MLFMGSPLLDFSCTCEESFLRKYNMKLDDCVLENNSAIFDELLQNPNVLITPGGSAQNSARVSKWLLREKGQVSFAGCVGRDEYAEIMKQELQKIGVNPVYYYHESLPTGLCACLVAQKGKRSMCTRLGAARTFGVEFLSSPIVSEKMHEADIIYITGYFLFHSFDAAMNTAEFCHENGKIFVLNLSANYICDSHTSKLMKCLPYVDILFGNVSEARALLEALSAPSCDVEGCVRYLASLPKKEKSTRTRVCIISQGADNVVVGQGDTDPKMFEVPPVDDIVDTIGCGDALVGGVLARLACSYDLEEAVKIGIKTAGMIARTSGCTLPSDEISLSS